MILAALPILFYRNAFPYFYVDMLAPAVVAHRGRRGSSAGAGRAAAPARRRANWVPTACGLSVAGARRIAAADDQLRTSSDGQRQVLDAVHRIFPQPVPYLDHCRHGRDVSTR